MMLRIAKDPQTQEGFLQVGVYEPCNPTNPELGGMVLVWKNVPTEEVFGAKFNFQTAGYGRMEPIK